MDLEKHFFKANTRLRLPRNLTDKTVQILETVAYECLFLDLKQTSLGREDQIESQNPPPFHFLTLFLYIIQSTGGFIDNFIFQFFTYPPFSLINNFNSF